MAYNSIFESIMALLVADASLVPGILGARTVTNQRLYRNFPASQQFLRGYEPNQPSEGWLVVEEPQPALRMASKQLESNHEFLTIMFHAFGTTYSLTHAVLDVLDTLFHWTIPQMRDVTWGNRLLLFTRRSHAMDKYQEDIKLYEKQIFYAMELVLTEDQL